MDGKSPHHPDEARIRGNREEATDVSDGLDLAILESESELRSKLDLAILKTLA